MRVPVYELTVNQFILALLNLKNILKKAETYSKVKNFDMSVLLQTRLFPDMFPLGKQVITSCDAAKYCGARLTDVPPPVEDDKEITLEDHLARIDRTIEFLKSLTPEDFKDFENKKVKFSWNPGQELNGKDYLIQFALPNFYFHVTSVYNILRSSGVEIGQADYLGPIHWQTVNE